MRAVLNCDANRRAEDGPPYLNLSLSSMPTWSNGCSSAETPGVIIATASRCPTNNKWLKEFSVSGSCMSKHLQYPDTEAIPEDLNADG